MADTNSRTKVLRLSDVEELADDKEKCIIIINNRVYDITKFLDEVCCSNVNFSFINMIFIFL